MKPTATSLDDRLGQLDRDALLTMLRTLLTENPRLSARVEQLIASKSSPHARTSPKPRSPAIDATIFRREAKQVLRSGSGGYGYDRYGATSMVYDGIEEILTRIRPLLDADDGLNALVALQPVMEVMLEDWQEYDDSDGYLGMTFDELGELFAEALLRIDPARRERENWRERLESWRDELADYGCEQGFLTACRAVSEGWDDPELGRVLEGEASQEITRAPSKSNDPLLRIRLRILENRGEHEAFLRLSLAYGALDAYTLGLVRTGRLEEAETVALEHLNNPQHLQLLAQAMHERGDTDRAFRIASSGLFCEKAVHATERYLLHPLATWLRSSAHEAGQRALALQAAGVAFTSSCEMEDYAAAREIAGDDWLQIRDDLLIQMATAENYTYPERKIAIYLHEGMIDEAVREADSKRFFFDSAILRRTMEAALDSHPDWVIRRSRKEAEEIMDAGRANAYDAAANWLSLTREAFVRTGRSQAWTTLLNSLIRTHHRKYKLRPMLEKLK